VEERGRLPGDHFLGGHSKKGSRRGLEDLNPISQSPRGGGRSPAMSNASKRKNRYSGKVAAPTTRTAIGGDRTKGSRIDICDHQPEVDDGHGRRNLVGYWRARQQTSVGEKNAPRPRVVKGEAGSARRSEGETFRSSGYLGKQRRRNKKNEIRRREQMSEGAFSERGVP